MPGTPYAPRLPWAEPRTCPKHGGGFGPRFAQDFLASGRAIPARIQPAVVIGNARGNRSAGHASGLARYLNWVLYRADLNPIAVVLLVGLAVAARDRRRRSPAPPLPSALQRRSTSDPPDGRIGSHLIA